MNGLMNGAYHVLEVEVGEDERKRQRPRLCLQRARGGGVAEAGEDLRGQEVRAYDDVRADACDLIDEGERDETLKELLELGLGAP